MPIILVTPLVGLARPGCCWPPLFVLTLVTQMPYQGMDLRRYLTEWFPYYAWTNTAPGDATRSMLWPGWTWRFVTVSLALCALIIYANGRGSTTVVTQRA